MWAAAAERARGDSKRRRRATEVWAHDRTGTEAIVVEALQSYVAVLDQVHGAVWEAM